MEIIEEQLTTLDRLRLAWKSAPTGAISKLYSEHGYTQQNVADILKNGRKDEIIIEDLLEKLKICSQKVADEINKSNQEVQDL